jgi:hypothetical protein
MQSLTAHAPRKPFFEEVLVFAVTNGFLTPEEIRAYSYKAPAAIVQIANHVGSAHLRPNLEDARALLVHAVSLGLEHACSADRVLAVQCIRTSAINKHSKSGFDLIRKLAALDRVPPDKVPAFLAKTLKSPLSLAEYRIIEEGLSAADALLNSLR